MELLKGQNPESRYVQTIAPIVRAKKEAADWEGEMPKGSVARALKASADAIDGYLTESGLGVRHSDFHPTSCGTLQD